MPLLYAQAHHTLNPAEILDSYIHWHSCVQQVLTYQKDQKIPLGIVAPSNFSEWSAEYPEQAKDLIPLHQDMVTQADALIKTAIDAGKPPAFADFDSFTQSYTKFCAAMAETVAKYYAGTQGIHPVTGLKQESLLQADFDRELDRLSRKNNPFVIALITIHKFSSIEPGKKDKIRKVAADLIARNLRSYDDAYDCGECSFVILLRQVPKSEGVTVLERSTKSFEDEEAVKALNDKNICLLSCVAEPLPGDKIETTLESLKEQSALYDVEGGTVIEHIEMSPFEKFVQSKQGH